VLHVTVLFSYSPHPSERDGNRRRRRASRYRPFFLLSTSISLHLGKVADSETSSSWSQINKRRTYERPTGVHFTEECQRGYVTHRHTAGRQHHLSLQRIRQCRRRRGSSSVLRQSRGLTHHQTPSRFCLPVAVHELWQSLPSYHRLDRPHPLFIIIVIHPVPHHPHPLSQNEGSEN